MLYRKHHDAVLKLVQPVLLAPILQRVEIGHEHFPSFIVVISSASRANPAFPEKRLTPRALVRRAEGRRRRPGAPLSAHSKSCSCHRGDRNLLPEHEKVPPRERAPAGLEKPMESSFDHVPHADSSKIN